MQRGELPSSERDDAATRIQAAQRGRVVRQATRVAVRAEPVFQKEKRGVTARKSPPLPQPAAAPPPAPQQPLQSSITVSQAEEEGYILSRNLLSQPPADLAKWALEQLEGLQSEDKSATESPVYKLALAQRELPAEERRKLICGAVSGLRELGEEEREDISRILGGALLHDGAAEFSEASPTLLRNLQTVAQAADFPSMPADDVAKLAEELREEIVQIVEDDPQLVLDLVDELGGDERKKLLDFLEDHDVLNTEQRSTAEKTIMPGGYMDQLGSALTVCCSFTRTGGCSWSSQPQSSWCPSCSEGRLAPTGSRVGSSAMRFSRSLLSERSSPRATTCRSCMYGCGRIHPLSCRDCRRRGSRRALRRWRRHWTWIPPT